MKLNSAFPTASPQVFTPLARQLLVLGSMGRKTIVGFVRMVNPFSNPPLSTQPTARFLFDNPCGAPITPGSLNIPLGFQPNAGKGDGGGFPYCPTTKPAALTS